MGAQVELISGGEYYDFKKQLQSAFPSCDYLIMAAAVSDFETVKPLSSKIKKQKDQSGLTLELKTTEDLLAAMGKLKKKHQKIVGFALETENGPENALNKLKTKNCDWMVLNSPATLGSDEIQAQILERSGKVSKLPKSSKIQFAEQLFETICRNSGLSQ